MDAQQKIRNSVSVDPNTGCWLWQGARNRRGYGRLYYSGKDYRAHRLAYVAFVCPIPSNMLVCHRCDVPQCVNPDHLFLGTAQDNEADKVSKGRQTRGDSHHARTHPECMPRGDAHGMTKLPDEKVREIRARYTGKYGQVIQFAKEYGVSRDLMHKIVHGRIRKSAGFPEALKLVIGPT